MIKNIVLAVSIALSIYLGFQVKNLNVEISKLQETCGEKCAGLFVNFNVSGLSEALEIINADKVAVKACLDSAETAGRINKDFDDAKELGLTGTPGNILLNKETKLGVLVPGAFPLEILEVVKGALLNPEAKVDDVVFEDGKNISLKIAEFPTLDEVTADDNVKGPAEAKVFLIEYSDFDCPYCKSFHPIAEEFINRNADSAWVFRHYPLRNIHPDAQKKAEAAECVKKLMGQDKFWEAAAALYQVAHN